MSFDCTPRLSSMSNLMVDFIISLDGYGGAEGWPGFWGMEGPEYLAWLGEPAEAEHVTLMGATTYRLMHGFAEPREVVGPFHAPEARPPVRAAVAVEGDDEVDHEVGHGSETGGAVETHRAPSASSARLGW